METLANLLKGLSEATRLRIINLLANGELCVCDLMEVLDIPQSTISRHLAYLRKSGWIDARRKGKWTYYRRPVQPTPVISYAFAMLDDEFANQPQAQLDKRVLDQWLEKKASGTCAVNCA